MAKCGKGCMPECEYFTTGGCMSPFNCPYKIETGYINSATSIPTYMGQYNGMSDDDIELCLERLSTCKATDVMNFDYSGTLAYIKRLKSENAALKERLEKAAELPVKIGDTVYCVDDEDCHYVVETTTVTQENFYLLCSRIKGNPSDAFLSREAAEALLKELNGGKNE